MNTHLSAHDSTKTSGESPVLATHPHMCPWPVLACSSPVPAFEHKPTIRIFPELRGVSQTVDKQEPHRWGTSRPDFVGYKRPVHGDFRGRDRVLLTWPPSTPNQKEAFFPRVGVPWGILVLFYPNPKRKRRGRRGEGEVSGPGELEVV
jgi:hypothetical protein